MSEWMNGCYAPSTKVAIYLISLRKFTSTGRHGHSVLLAKEWSVQGHHPSLWYV